MAFFKNVKIQQPPHFAYSKADNIMGKHNVLLMFLNNFPSKQNLRTEFKHVMDVTEFV